QSVAQYGVPLYHVHRADLHQALARAVRALDAEAIVLGHTLMGIEQDARAIHASFANGATCSSDWLLGADGIRSAARAVLFGADTPKLPATSPIVAWSAPPACPPSGSIRRSA
ncbi:MAG TPA: hypothetical protein P5528_15580, partial [Steroidobacteraceae bacterium]|nr:hypothetical protein [Steroidobacteraceae bacterium]